MKIRRQFDNIVSIWRNLKKMHHLQLKKKYRAVSRWHLFTSLFKWLRSSKKKMVFWIISALMMSKMTVRKTVNSGPTCARNLDIHELAHETCWQVDFSCFIYFNVCLHVHVHPTHSGWTHVKCRHAPIILTTSTTRSIILFAYMPPTCPPLVTF